jgi:hypothetical protein
MSLEGLAAVLERIARPSTRDLLAARNDDEEAGVRKHT